MKKKLYLFITYLFLSVIITTAMANNKFVVVIDAGHGGKDGGASRGIYKEKDINLAIALALGRQIESNMNDVKVIYTRKSDVFIDLYKRSDIANKAKANLFISIHTNSTASKTTTASGADTYILGLAKSKENLDVAKRENSVILLEDNYSTRYEGFDPNSPESNIIFEFMANKYMEQSLDFASYIQGGFRTIAKRTDRGIAQAGFLVLKESSMPSVLIEVGFINNPKEAEFLSSKRGQQKMAESIFYGFRKYKNNFDKREGIKTAKKTTDKNLKDEKKNEKIDSIIGVEYRVQFLISNKKLPEKSQKFEGLSPVDYYVENGIYKYTYGKSQNQKDAIKIANSIRSKFKDAFVIKFENGNRVK